MSRIQRKKKVVVPEVLAPVSIKQEQLINSESTITLLAGSAGAAKSYGLLLAFLKHVMDPYTTGVIFRRTTKQLDSPGGLWSEAVNMYKKVDSKVKIKDRDHEVIFSTGAKLKFTHLEHESNVYDHMGGQYSFVGFDEGTHFTEMMILYLISRMRNFNVSYKPRMLITCNPDYDSFLRHWVQWYLDPDTGIPDPSKNNIERYFMRSGNDMIWADTREELEEQFGSSVESGIQSFRLIAATCRDNPILLAKDPAYMGRLKALPRVERLRLLDGSWTARAQNAGYFKREWTDIVDIVPLRTIKRVRAWDFAATLPSEANPDPDFSVGTLMSKQTDNRYTVEHVLKFRDRFAGVEQRVFEQARLDGPDTVVILPQDPGAAGKAYCQDLQRRLGEKGFTARVKTQSSSKLTRFGPFASVAEAGSVRVLNASWNNDFFEELESFTGTREDVHDDQVDSVADAFWGVKTGNELPTFLLPDLKTSNTFGFARGSFSLGR